MKRFKILNGGHADLPNDLEQRWSTRFVMLEDHGDHLILRPAPDEASIPREAEERWPEEEISPSLKRGSTGAGF